MNKKNLKKVLALVAGSLVVALVISILPGGFLVNAERVSARAARRAALEYVNDDSAKVIELDDKGLDDKLPVYKVKVKTDKSEYIVEVDAKTAETKLNSRKRLDDNTVVTIDDFKDFDDFKEYIEDDGYDDFDIDKPTAEAELNQVIKEGKKLAIAEYKEAKDDLDKEDDDYKELKKEAQQEFKDAKDALKEIKKEAQSEIKENKKQNNNDKAKDDKDDKDEGKIVKNVKINDKQALLIALERIGIDVDSRDLKDIDAANSVKKYREILGLKDLEIEMDDDNPPAYEIEIETDDYKYEIIIHATSGTILDYKREATNKVENNDKKPKKENKNESLNNDDDDDDDDDNKNNNGNNGNSNNGKNTKEKSNNGKGNNK